MAVVLYSLRLWLLLLNLYGTFKAMKPPMISGRSARNGQGPSVRAMQLRKRELKSRLAAWIVWGAFLIIERPLDCTIGLFAPLYNELKCIILIFLLISRSHGAEAIFLHVIHPSLRPYVPAVDRVLATAHSIFDLLALVALLPWEYVWCRCPWHWSWKRTPEPAPDAPHEEDTPTKPLDRQGRSRPCQKSQHKRLKEANKQAQVIFQEIEDAQDRVRVQTRSQFARTNAHTLPGRNRRAPDNNFVASSQPAKETATITSDTSSFNRPYHEIWYPPQSSRTPHRRRSTPLDASSRKTPSPVYPPLPSAYPFTPRRSESPPAPPRIVNPPDLVSPTPRRVSTTALEEGKFNAYDGIDRFPELRPSYLEFSKDSTSRNYSGHQVPRENKGMESLEFFGSEPTIQTAEADMDMENLGTTDVSSAKELPMKEAHKNNTELKEMMNWSLSVTRETDTHTFSDVKSKPNPGPEKSLGPSRRSSRIRNDRFRVAPVETDEFGFTIRHKSSALESPSIEPKPSSSRGTRPFVAPVSSKTKPLARTKPALKPTQQDRGPAESSDEESTKKKRKVKSGNKRHPSANGQARPVETTLKSVDDEGKTRMTRKRAMAQNTEPDDVVKDQLGVRTTRTSTKPPLDIKKGKKMKSV